MKPTLKEIGDLMKTDGGRSDKHYYGQIQAVKKDGSGKAVGYEVSLGGSSDRITCRKLAGAKVGDTVMVTLLSSGVAVVTGTLGGDADAADAVEIAANVQRRADSGEFDGRDGISVRSVSTQWCLSSSNVSFIPGPHAWQETIPSDVSGMFLWMRSKITHSDGSITYSAPVFDRSGQMAAEANDVASSLNNHFWYDANGAHVSKAVGSVSTGAAITIGASGIIQSINGKAVLSQTASGLQFYQSDGETKIAEYGSGGMTVYAGGSEGTAVDAYGLTIQGYIPGNKRGEVARIYSGSGATESGGTAIAPYYTFGTRAAGKIGNYSFSEGYENQGSACATHCEGGHNVATGNYSHAEGYGNTASSYETHVEGYLTTASAQFAHAEGGSTVASKTSAHAEGYNTTASNTAAHSEGITTVASGYASHAGNFHTKASGSYQTAIGKYNREDTSGVNALIVGNGTSSAASNALALDWDGNLTLKDHASPVGTIKSSYLANDKTVKTATGTMLCSISLEPGIWVVCCGVRFPASNTTGIRRANLNSASAATAENWQIQGSSHGQQGQFVRICAPEETTTYYLNVYQTSGTTITMPAGEKQTANYIYAVRIV